MAQALLASAAELSTWCQSDVANDLATLVLGMVSSAAAAAAGPVGSSWDAVSVPGQVKLVILAAAGRVVTNPTGLRSETLGGYSYTAGDTGGLLTAAELAVCQRTGGVPTGAVSVPLRVSELEFTGHSRRGVSCSPYTAL